ncbi:17776_t:CDS:10 [Rhizophagus irregularis]|nr:17776_t:CDS:10 [Rhizophagus irregularis]
MAQQQLQKYELTPPKNLVRLHKESIELGFPDFYPPKSGQDEDQMTEENVKKGFIDSPFVQNEHFSAHDVIFDELKKPDTLKNLGDFMTDVMKRKNETTFQGSSQFMGPTIVWVTVEERDKWLRDLAGNVPLKILARSVPKGVDGKDLLESVTLYRVPLARATWFTKVVGINKIIQRGNTDYTKEWTSIFYHFIRDQSLSHDPDKWRYSILLAKWQFDEQLLDQRLLRFTLEQLDEADHCQTPMWLWLVQQFLSEFQRSRTLMRLLIEIIIKKLQDIHQHPHIIIKLELVVKLLKNMLHTLFITTPDMFVFPVCWNTYKDLLRVVLVDDDSKTDPPNLKHQRERYFEAVRSRNEIFDDKKINPLGMSNARDALDSRMISILDKITYRIDYHNITAEYFRTNSNFQMMEREVSRHIHTLCRWTITPFREGDFRAYSVSTILDIWKNGVSDVKEKLERETIIQSSLVEFLDIYPFGVNGLNEREESEAIARLFGVLTKNGHFSYQRYLQRLIARGDVRPEKRTTERSLRHLRYVKWFAIYETDLHDLNHSINQRWHILYGINSKDTSDKNTTDTLSNIVSEKLPNVFSPKAKDMNAPIVDDPGSDFNCLINFDDSSLEFIQNATKFCQFRVVQEFLIPSVKRFVQNTPIDDTNWKSLAEPGSSLLNARQLATIVQFIELTKDYSSLLELIIWVLENSMERTLFPLIVDTIKRYEMIWDAMGKSDGVFDVLMKKNDQLREKRATEICIVKYLSGVIQDPEKKSKLDHDYSQFPTKSPLSVTISRNRDRLGQDVKNLLNRTRGFELSIASNIDSRWFQSDSVDVYLHAILESCTDVIHRHLQNYSEWTDARKLLDVIGDLLKEVGDRTTDGFDAVFSKKWLNYYIRADDDDSLLRQDRFLIFFTVLVVRHLVKIETILEHLVEKNLIRFSDKLLNKKQLDSNEIIECRNLAILLRIFLIHKNVSSGIPLTTMEIQRLQFICESFIHNNDFTIISNVFQKLAIIESSLGSNDDLAIELQQLRMDFSQVYWFKQLCIANIDNVYDRFVKGTKKQNNSKEVKKLMIEIVRSGLGNFSYDNDVMNGYSSSLCFKNLERIFSTVNLWNIQKSRIEFFMCMDQIMLLDSSSNGSLHSNMELDGDLIMGGSEEDLNNIKSRVIEYFWEELVLKGNNDCLIISHIIRGIREDVAAELLEHGLTVLKRCGELIIGIEEVFRALLLSVRDNKKEFSEALINQIQKIIDENKDHTFVPCIMTRIKLFVLVANVLAARVTAVVTTNSIEFANRVPEYNLIMKWVVTLINLLCSERIHQNGGGADNFDLILDIVSFLIDEMGKIPRAIVVAELKRYHFNIPVIWSNRIKRVLPLNIPKETLGRLKHELDAWQLIEGIGENDDLNNSAIDLSWYDAKFYQKPSKRLKRSDEYEDYNLDFNKKYNEENGHLEP